ncbi:hypothetical protein OQA88_12605 [Cercophora sp. LCS_1]
MAPKLRITLVQFEPKPLSPEANFSRAASQIQTAAASGSHLVILPEYHLSSWVPESPSFTACCAEAATYLPRYQALARDLNIHICPGTIITQASPVPDSTPATTDTTTTTPPPTTSEDSKPALSLHNLTYVLAAGTGTILSTYQKRNLWHPERGVLTPGTTTPHTAFSLPIPGTDESIKAGLLICWDLAFPEPFRQLACHQGAELILIPAWWLLRDIDPEIKKVNPDAEVMFIDSVVTARAYENTCAVAFCNAFGRSQVSVPAGGCLGAMGEGDMVKHVEIDFGVLRSAESVYKVRQDVKAGLA